MSTEFDPNIFHDPAEERLAVSDIPSLPSSKIIGLDAYQATQDARWSRTNSKSAEILNISLSGTGTGSTISSTGCASIRIDLIADRASATNGVILEARIGPTNWYTYTLQTNSSANVLTTVTAAASSIFGGIHGVPEVMRVKYINGAVGAAVVQIMLGTVIVPGAINETIVTVAPTAQLANATYLGNWIDCRNIDAITFLVGSDVASAAGGLKMDFSHDGSTLAGTHNPGFAVAAGKATLMQFGGCRTLSYVRLRYTNGAVNQATFDYSFRGYATPLIGLLATPS